VITNDIAERFARDIGPHVYASGRASSRAHEMTVLHDDGLYRHLRFKSPDHGAYWFDIITWPGCLTIRGDLNTGYTFARMADMFEFFRGKGINPGYWAEKLDAGINSVKEYSEDRFRQLVVDHLDEFADQDPMLAQTAKAEILANKDIVHSEGARSVLSDWEARGAFSNTWEWDLRDFDWSFLWACHAIVFGIAQYDAVKSVSAAELAGAVAR
jgi:hypothetical protein